MMKRLQEPTRRAALGLIGSACVLPRMALAAGGGVETLSGRAFGTGWRVSAPEGQGLARLAPEIDALFARIDRQLSPWRPDSAISRFNASGTEGDNPALCHVASAAVEIAGPSEGAFDPTVGPLVARWGFGPVSGGAPDWRALSVSAESITKQRADLTLDLCGIAKGWALDRAMALMGEAGFTDVLFDLGGELSARGHHPTGRDWRVAVDAPFPGAPSPATLRLPDGAAVATSGTGVQSYALGGRRYSHVIDPRAEAPVAGRLRAVSVVAPDAMSADGWATALLAAGEERGPGIARARNLAALFLLEDAGALRQVRTGAIDDMIL